MPLPAVLARGNPETICSMPLKQASGDKMLSYSMAIMLVLALFFLIFEYLAVSPNVIPAKWGIRFFLQDSCSRIHPMHL
jgi:hypothetical protein